MKILLVAYYWYPWNNAGSFRWLHLSRWIPITTLITSKKAKNSFYDETMPQGRAKILIRWFKLRPAIWAIVMTPVIIVAGLFHQKIIVTIPTETLLLPAYILQCLGKSVYVDLRDAIDRKRQPLKILIPVYRGLYRRIKKAVAVWRFLDPNAVTIRHGYEEIRAKNWVKRFDTFESKNRMRYKEYLQRLSEVYCVDITHKEPGYATSSISTYLKYNVRIIGADLLHKECFEFEPQPWEEIAREWWEYLGLSGFSSDLPYDFSYMPLLPIQSRRFEAP